MTVAQDYNDDDISFDTRHRNFPKIPPEDLHKIFPHDKKHGDFKTTPAFLMPLLLAGSLAGVCIKDIRSPISIGFIARLSYVICMAGFFGMLSTYQLIELFLAFKNNTENIEEVRLLKLSCVTIFCGDFFTFVAIVYMLLHNTQLNQFYSDYHKAMYLLKDYFNLDGGKPKRKFLMLMYGVYSALTILSSVSMAVSFWYNESNYSNYFLDAIGTKTVWKRYVGLFFHIFKPLVVMIAWSYFEVTLAIMSYGMQNVFKTISDKVDQAMDRYEEADANWTLESFGRKMEKHMQGNESLDDILSNFETMIGNGNNLSLEDAERKSDFKFEKEKDVEDKPSVTIGDITQLTLKSMEDHYRLSDLTRQLNAIFGPLLLFDLCLYLFMITALLYGSIKGMNSQSAATDIMLGFNNMTYIIRFFIILPVYSKVHESANGIILTYTRVMAIAPDILTHRISLYIQQLGNNPVGISAWVFFIVTLGTMLTFWGSVITYLVVLFKNASES